MKRLRLDHLILPGLGFALVLALWYLSSATWAKDLPNPTKTWQASRAYVLDPFAKRGESGLQDELGRIWQEHRTTVVLITNDPDEGIHLADRIVPLSAGPGATLGPSIPIDLPRPRDRRTLLQVPRFKEIRREVTEYLLRSRRAGRTACSCSTNPSACSTPAPGWNSNTSSSISGPAAVSRP